MKTLYFFFVLFTTYANAQTPPNDSCAISIQYGSGHFWYCDNGIFKTLKGQETKESISKSELNLVLIQMKSHQKSSAVKIEEFKVPNDSCAMGVTHGQAKYLRCDQGHFKAADGKKYEGISSSEWNETLRKLPSFQGCEEEFIKAI